jgi:putative hydrolase of the HAD superfamily
MENITAVFFDLDHTLWDFDKNSKLAFQRVFAAHKISIDIQDFITVYEPINEAYWKKYRENKVTKDQLRIGRLADSFSALQISFSHSVLNKMAHKYIEELPGNNHLFEGAIDLLTYLKTKYSLHIITNGFQEVQHKKMENSGLFPFFESITASEEVGLKKPHPVVFKTALKKAQTLPNKSIMIGDSLEADIIGAQNVGMKTIYFNYKNKPVSNNLVSINHLSEIKNYL